MSTIESGQVDIYDPDWYVSGDVHGTLADLRAHDPVHWQDMPGEPGYWAVLRHADVVHVARNPEVFSAWRGSVVLEDLQLVAVADLDERQVVAADVDGFGCALDRGHGGSSPGDVGAPA